METKPFIIERVYNAPVDAVWKAITDKNEMKQWYFDLKEFKAEPGFEFSFTAGPDEKSYLHLCRVTEVVPRKKISYTWKYDGYPGESKVTFELFPEGENTRLKLTHEGLETFPSDNPDFAKESFATGWNQIVGTSLKEYLEKKRVKS
jgi:uncharacterized protein YndB with AHSA1/START domain